ncbi:MULTISPECIES: BON domain-containing protein [Novosphingobium]|uniref:Osmotically-inducible protein OsmY n=1 Tax=Novosphingobium sediminicola TaxID=563162 RepID=A0A7W6CM51_9SPHN|nr:MULTISPECIES: BON domain-containing protein [Novosphingobium]MBB3957184.1 osmotically-inducible protein OsmY [Novosphingobium sediminicola]MBN9143669.1 BON domain-containing protein [Novosphingobium sp.]MDR6706924.1 osmotically-inducible protein OsmY [Novosphingobium sp. 1748]ODU83586.1 MAG: ornithine aminotransferase [Novosphingobium sp. SCN 63-17]OJX92831.1 MAG: ornithine aminotransferase [Novosphingobium sp. 63-713]
MKTDVQLQGDVVAELEWEPSIDQADIGVAVVDGVVTLSGYVKSYAEKLAAERAARRVSGVKAIAQELQVRFKTDPKTADHEIAKRIVDIMHWAVLIPEDRIHVTVEHGWVTLTGTVDWHYQRDEASQVAARISGVTGVSNNILVASHVSSPEVRKRIQDAFERQADLDAAAVTITLDGGKVTLGGKVRAPYERRVAEQAAWAAPGVTQVEDHIIVL